MDRYSFEEQLQALTTSIGTRLGAIDRNVGDVKKLAISGNRQLHRGRPSSELSGRQKFTKHALIKFFNHENPGDTYRERFLVGKAATSPAMTTVPEWAGLLSADDTMGFLLGGSTPSLLARLLSLGLTIGDWPVKIPYRADSVPLGGWTAEADPAAVGSLSLASITPTVRKVVAISTFSRELRKHSNPAIETILDTFLRRDINFHVDRALVDALPANAKRPAGLLAGAASVAPGADLAADLKLLAAAVLDAGGTAPCFLVNPLSLIDLGFMAGSFSYPLLDSPHVPANRLICLDALSFVGSLSAATLQTTEDAVIHMEDTTPLPIVGGAGVVATPVSSLWQTGRIGMSATLDAGWAVVPGRIAFIDQATP